MRGYVQPLKKKASLFWDKLSYCPNGDIKLVRELFEQIIQFFSDAAVSGRVRHEGQMTRVELAGGESIDRITGFIGKGCQSALDRSTEGTMLGPEQRLPAANNLLVSVYLDHTRAVRFQQVTDTQDLARNLSRAMTEYTHKQRFLVIGNRVEVPGISIRDVDESGRERVEVFWKRSEPSFDRPTVVSTSASSKPMNEPSRPEVKGSDKVTAESSEDEARLSEAFDLWVRDGQNEPVLWEGLLTPFYFGKDTKHPQVTFDFAPKDQISRDHFAILYLPRERFLIRNNGRNGTMIVRGNRAVRLYTPPSMRERPGSARIARLSYNDVIRVQAGPLDATRIVQMAFCKPGTPLDEVIWIGSLEEIYCADSIEPVARRIRNGGPPDQYTLICGEQYLGSAITQGVKFSYDKHDIGFVGGGALAVVTNFGGVSVRWLREDVTARVGNVIVSTGSEISLRPGDTLFFGSPNAEILPTSVVFDWTEQGS
jgi:hypothetical protein